MAPEEPKEEFLRRALDRRQRFDPPTPSCLDDDTIAALAGGTLASGARAAALPHVATCARCRTAVASVARALADRGVTDEIARLERTRPSRRYRIALPIAAAAILVLLIARPRAANQDGEHRGPPVSGVPVPVAPAGVVAAVTGLQWRSVPGADQYRMTLFDSNGRVLYEILLRDTAAALPDSVVLSAGTPYLWKVEARVGFNRWAASQLVEFSLAARPAR